MAHENDDKDELAGSPETDTVEFASASLERAIDWVKFADAKAGAVLVIVGLLLTDSVDRAGSLRRAYQAGGWQGDWATILFWASIFLSVIVVSLVSAALFPRVKPQTHSLAYFGTVAEMDSKAYRRKIEQLSSAEALDHIAMQSWEVSRIASAKFRLIRHAYSGGVLFLVCYSMARLLMTWRG